MTELCKDGKCGKCPACEQKKSLMVLGFSEDAASTLARETYPLDFSEDITPMIMGRLKVIIGRCQDIMQAVQEAHMAAKMTNGEVEMESWMVDKMTLAADYLSAVADGVKYGDYGLEVDTPYAEKKGLWANIHAKRERIKRGSGERMRKPGEKGAPSAADLKAADADDDKKKK